MRLITIPSESRLMRLASETPEYMLPNVLPTAVVAEEFLDARHCANIVRYMEQEEHYRFRNCNAITTEAERPLNSCFNQLVMTANLINEQYWNFDLDTSAAYMQTYHTGNDYRLHTDAAPGQARKLTAVLMLSDDQDYDGGHLSVRIEPQELVVSKLRGTVAVFPSWVPHSVAPVTRGIRQTINLGFWGPPFR